MTFTADHTFTTEDWAALGKETGRLRYEGEEEGAHGFIPADGTVRGRFTNWDPKPRIFREYANGEIEITKDVWK